MSSSMMHTSYTEKNPLLPITSDEECQRLECQRNKSYKSKYRRQGFLFVLFLMILSLYNAYYDKIRVSIGNKNNDAAIYSDNEVCLIHACFFKFTKLIYLYHNNR